MFLPLICGPVKGFSLFVWALFPFPLCLGLSHMQIVGAQGRRHFDSYHLYVRALQDFIYIRKWVWRSDGKLATFQRL